MQSLISELQSLLDGRLALGAGLCLLGLLFILILCSAFNAVIRTYYSAQQRRLSLEKLRLQVKAAELQYREAEGETMGWGGFRKFQVMKKVRECDDVYSFYLEAHDRKPVPPFSPGQYLTFQIPVPGASKPEIRCYSLSDVAPSNGAGNYRVTIKKHIREDKKPGAVSSFFCETLKEGDILDVKRPSGRFCLNLSREAPVVLISGGVGVTPMLAMLNAIVASGSKREVWFFYGVRNRSEHIQKEHLETMAARYDHVHLHVCYSKPGAEDRIGVDFQHEGRVCVDLMKSLLPSNNFEYYICGPPAMMNSVTSDLYAWGVPKDSVFFEAFGPATVKVSPPTTIAGAAPAPSLQTLEVTFNRSGQKFLWDGSKENLFQFAQGHRIELPSGCLAGNCGSCLVAIKSGEVEYVSGHGAPGEDRSCLTCIAKPKSALVLDA